jgi:hypothetical protein
MPLSIENNRRRGLAGFCLAALGVLYLTNPLTQLIVRGADLSPLRIALIGFASLIHMALAVGSVIGITQLLRGRADRTGLTGGALMILGWAVGTRILLLGQFESLLQSGVAGLPQNAMRMIFEAAPIVYLSVVPVGLLYPIGVITLGIALAATGPIPRWIGVLLAAGGLLFPIGRIFRLSWALVSCDLVLGAAFALIGWQILTRRELWE